ncbi:MAG TPA: hypothetical protein VGF82_20885 [Terracidiphilus sp.]
MRSFLRMAGISQEVGPDEVLPMLARNVSLYGFSSGKPKEYLVLVERYVHFARDLRNLANANGTIRITGCRDAGSLLSVLGYRLTQVCGNKATSLMTSDAERAFQTIDSGFPLTMLEQALQKDGPFTYSFPATRVPVLLNEQDWVAASGVKKNQGDSLLDVMLRDQNLDRLYVAISRCDEETRQALQQSTGLGRLLPLAAVMDLYGGQINVKGEQAVVPGGADKAWQDLAGEDPHAAGKFVLALLSKDGGWLAAYFDVLSRLDPPQQAHLTEGARLKRFYEVYRSTATKSNASKGVYPRNGDLLVLMSALRWRPDGDLAIPGDLNLWNEILAEMAKSREVRPWLGRGHEWNTSGKLLETLIASSNYRSETGPVQVYLMLSAIDAGRAPEAQMSPETEKLIAHRYPQFAQWFRIFAEYPALDDTAITNFMKAADKVDGISNSSLRANALGALQANVGIWRIFARQHQIPDDQVNSSWQKMVQPFLTVSSSAQLFDAARTSFQASLQAVAGTTNLSQDQIIDLLAGPLHDDRDSQRVHHEISEKIRAVLDDQRLVSLDTLFGLYEGLNQIGKGTTGAALLPLAEDLREFELPRPIFSGNERLSWAPAVYTSRHAELQVRTDLTKILKSAATPAQLEAARAQLTPFLRDTLVGLNYAYYEPPGAEVLHNNPLFVRSHDFSSISVQGVQEIWGEPRLVGVGATAGGGAYLLGSLAELPYALAMTEEDFIVPRHTQALIWREIVPDLLVDSTLPRWWNVSKNEMHLAAQYQRAGEELLTASVEHQDLRAEVSEILSNRMAPVRLEHLNHALLSPESATLAVSEMVPADVFYLAIEFRKQHPDQVTRWGAAQKELDELCQKYPAEASWERMSADFGVPHPVLTLTESSVLLRMKAISTYGGSAGRIFAESWDSNNLYWARLADEMGYSPADLNLLAPQLTRDMIANIFASNIDDWPALLRAMVVTGSEFRKGKIALQASLATPQQ